MKPVYREGVTVFAQRSRCTECKEVQVPSVCYHPEVCPDCGGTLEVVVGKFKWREKRCFFLCWDTKEYYEFIEKKK